MKIAFHGAARMVTGSKHLITLNDGTKILLDCGMFQGMGPKTDNLNEHFGFKPKDISYVFLSHAHIDHTGLIPKLVKEGFEGPIYCTEATRDLSEILLMDSAEIQTYETDYINKKRAAQNLPPYQPLYTAEEALESLKLFKIIPYDEWVTINENIKVQFTNTGHLIGSATINLEITENGKETRFAFSGDVGRAQSILLPPPSGFPQADYIIMESTYGNKHHDLSFTIIKTLRQLIEKTCVEKMGQLIIPAFSVGRTQEVLYALNQLSLEKRLPEINYYVDSPLSQKATEVIKKYKHLFNERLQQVLEVDDDPFSFPGLKYIESVEDSRKLVDYSDPCVIISASGTADAGRVRHHIHRCADNAKNTILIVGYCSPESLGGQLLSGAKEIELFGEQVKVLAEINQLAGMSAHGDTSDLTNYIGCQDPDKVKIVFLVHGEYEVQQSFAPRLELKGFKQVEIPALHDEYELE